VVGLIRAAFVVPYRSTPFMSSRFVDSSRSAPTLPSFDAVARLIVEADFDPQLPSRVLGRLAACNDLPDLFVARCRRPDSLSIELEFQGDADAAGRLARQLQNVPSVRSVNWTITRRRIAAAA